MKYSDIELYGVIFHMIFRYNTLQYYHFGLRIVHWQTLFNSLMAQFKQKVFKNLLKSEIQKMSDRLQTLKFKVETKTNHYISGISVIMGTNVSERHHQNDHTKFNKIVSAPIHHHRHQVFQHRNHAIMVSRTAGVNGQNGMFVRLLMKEDVMGGE